MHTALNKTLAAVDDDTYVYVSLYIPLSPSIISIDNLKLTFESSPVTNTPKPTLNSQSPFLKVKQ